MSILDKIKVKIFKSEVSSGTKVNFSGEIPEDAIKMMLQSYTEWDRLFEYVASKIFDEIYPQIKDEFFADDWQVKLFNEMRTLAIKKMFEMTDEEFAALKNQTEGDAQPI